VHGEGSQEKGKNKERLARALGGDGNAEERRGKKDIGGNVQWRVVD